MDNETLEMREALVALRRRATVTQDSIARHFGVSGGMLSLWERGERPLPEDFEARYRQAVADVAREKLAAAVAA